MKAIRIVADLLFTNHGPPLRNAAVELHEDGRVMAISEFAAPGLNDVHVAVASPGFVNAHCHLELSHLKGRIADDARGMAHFIGAMMAFRQSPQTVTQTEWFMAAADRFMWQEGVVAVGDISNTTASIPVKEKSLIRYHTFVEVMGLATEQAEAIHRKGEELKKAFDTVLGPDRASVTPHALYSVSADLLRKIVGNHPGQLPLSIHMQESLDEIDYCRDKSGPMAALFKDNSLPDSGFVAYGNEYPLISLLRQMSREVRLQSVHNTFTDPKDVRKAVGMCNNLFFCLCPSANLFITGQLPDVTGMLDAGAMMTVGTDSLASNDRLSMVKELTLLQHHFPSLPAETLIRWATLHGARFLGVEQEFGSVVPGKAPGLVMLENMNPDDPCFHAEVVAKRLE
jgi:cytosine/adenosine deaminase-related metal-dependent hydrolase